MLAALELEDQVGPAGDDLGICAGDRQRRQCFLEARRANVPLGQFST
jgi:hypothetical protein